MHFTRWNKLWQSAQERCATKRGLYVEIDDTEDSAIDCSWGQYCFTAMVRSDLCANKKSKMKQLRSNGYNSAHALWFLWWIRLIIKLNDWIPANTSTADCRVYELTVVNWRVIVEIDYSKHVLFKVCDETFSSGLKSGVECWPIKIVAKGPNDRRFAALRKGYAITRFF